MKKLLTILMLCGVCCGYAQNTPPHAATTRTWTVGEQTWSDAIHIPACNKKNRMDSSTEPQCRSYTEGANTWYYYNWPYVQANAAKLCPAPWRVPDLDETHGLTTTDLTPKLARAWGYGGLATPDMVLGSENIYAHWIAHPAGKTCAVVLWYSKNVPLSVTTFGKEYGLRARCVK
jgi:hypothetical protein